MIDKLHQFVVLVAAKPSLKASDVNLPNTGSDQVFNGLLGLAYWAAGVVAVVVIIVAGIIFATSEGQPEKATRARKMIQYAVVGIIVVLLAATITQFVIGRF